MVRLVRIDRAAWNRHWLRVPRAPLLQSWEYGEAQCRTRKCRAHRFMLEDARGRPLGLLQVLSYSLPLIGGVARINRGPVFFADCRSSRPSTEEIRQAIAAVRHTARQHRWWFVRMVPELLNNDDAVGPLSELGFSKRPTAPPASAVIALDRSPEEIRAGFHGKWRNCLKKSEKLEVELEIPPAEEALPYLITRYEEIQRSKGFRSIPTRLLRNMVRQEGPNWHCRILFARQRGERHGAVAVVGHGDTCTYLIGWTSPEGRQLQANYFLLWQAMLHYKDLGYKFFDVGGLGSNTTDGIARFKRRLRGEEYSLLGEYTYSRLPLPLFGRE